MPFPTDPFEQLHYNMVRVHHTLKLGYSSIIKNLEESKAVEEDLLNFLGYCHAWVTTIIAHHDTEEALVFPLLNQKMDFAHEAEAHEVIHKSLSDLEAVILEAKANPEKFNAVQFKEQIMQAKDALFSHLDEEVEHIKPEELRKAGFGAAELKELDQQLSKYAQTHGDQYIIVPYIRSHTPPEFKAFWPPMPWILRKVIIPYVLARRYSGYWKYSPYSV